MSGVLEKTFLACTSSMHDLAFAVSASEAVLHDGQKQSGIGCFSGSSAEHSRCLLRCQALRDISCAADVVLYCMARMLDPGLLLGHQDHLRPTGAVYMLSLYAARRA